MDFDFLLTTAWNRTDIQLAGAWADELERRGYRTAVFTPSEKEIPTENAEVFRLSSLVSRESIDLRSIEQRYDIPSISQLSVTEREYFTLTEAETRRRIRRSVDALETLFENHEFDYCLQERGGEIHRLLAQYYTEHYGGTTIWRGFGFFDDSFSVSTHLRELWDTYDIIEYDEIPDEGKEWTREYIEEFRNRRKHFTYGSTANNRIVALLDTIRDQVINRDQPGQVHRVGLNAAKRKLKGKLNKRICTSVSRSETFCEEERYVFFPLQYRAESRLTVYAPEHYDQCWSAEYLARILPEGVTLCVKPHPHHPGEESPRWLYDLNQRSNVEVLHPDLHSHDAIRGAEAVVTINNTAGVEALIFGKSVVNMGRAFYSHIPGVRRVTDLGSLPEVIAEAIDDEPTETDIVESVYSLRQTLHDADRAKAEQKETRATIDAVLDLIEQRAD
ncbi:hypothetical protein [Halohasta salina]|uniref:capsular polysaccharide export protein, LipB/KpsS family n=1 Tax=Halohasta salina TaxID=2961621 RepID=UPI0020A5B004|nr:hypothetical protein [Halohasta salina]